MYGMMTKMNMNHVKSFFGKHVNIHLKDGSVIINVKVLTVRRKKLLYTCNSKHETLKLSAIDDLIPVEEILT